MNLMVVDLPIFCGRYSWGATDDARFSHQASIRLHFITPRSGARYNPRRLRLKQACRLLRFLKTVADGGI